MKYFYVFLGIAIFCHNPLIYSIKYEQTELFTITWGDGTNELKVAPRHVEGIISDTTDYEDEPGYGPSGIFVDQQQNIVIYSNEFNQLKGFDKNGNLIFNFSNGEVQFDPNICPGQPSAIYVDSLLRLYILVFPELPYLPIVNYNGTVEDKFYPFSDTNAPVLLLTWNSQGILTFYSAEHGYITFRGGELQAGGSPCFLAIDGYSYCAFVNESTGVFTFGKYLNPDKRENPETSIETEITIPADSVYSAILLYGGDGNYLYSEVFFKRGNIDYYGVWIFDLDYKYLGEIVFLSLNENYLFYLDPFISADGAIYESRILDDGLHVIKWTKQ
jgi:hypothetical protein